MAYDEALAARIRSLLGNEEGVTERKMFGGLAFLVYGNMTVAASGKGGLLARVDPKQTKELLESTPATPMIMHGREMPGWLRVASKHVADDGTLTAWVNRCLTYAQTLPPKEK